MTKEIRLKKVSNGYVIERFWDPYETTIHLTFESVIKDLTRDFQKEA